MSDFEVKIYSVEVTFPNHDDCLERFCHDLEIIPEYGPKIEEDTWGLMKSLEIWFQKIEPQNLRLHIQKRHFKHNKTYLKDLKDFEDRVGTLSYVKEAIFN